MTRFPFALQYLMSYHLISTRGLHLKPNTKFHLHIKFYVSQIDVASLTFLKTSFFYFYLWYNYSQVLWTWKQEIIFDSFSIYSQSASIPVHFPSIYLESESFFFLVSDLPKVTELFRYRARFGIHSVWLTK